MNLVLDTHVHIYPVYDLAALVSSAWRQLNMALHSSGDRVGAVYGLLLTERSGCRFYKQLECEPDLLPEGWSVIDGGNDGLCLSNGENKELVLIPGHQHVTRERIEVLGLCLRNPVPEGKSLRETIDAVRDAGGVPVMPWSPGKWRGRRGQVLGSFVDNPGDGPWLLGDSLMRPASVMEPQLFTRAREAGAFVVPGSDSLPFAGEEKLVGRFAMTCRVEGLDTAVAIRTALTEPHLPRHAVGRRLPLLRVARRWVKLKTGNVTNNPLWRRPLSPM